MSEPPPPSSPILDYHRPDPPPLPVGLVVVAWLFIAFGILSAIQMVAGLFQGSCSVQLGVLGIFVGRGLLRLSPGWRTCGLVFLWLSLIGIPLIVLVLLMAKVPLTVTFFGQVVRGVSARRNIMLATAISTLAIWIGCVWVYRILVRNDVRKLFGL